MTILGRYEREERETVLKVVDPCTYRHKGGRKEKLEIEVAQALRRRSGVVIHLKISLF